MTDATTKGGSAAWTNNVTVSFVMCAGGGCFNGPTGYVGGVALFGLAVEGVDIGGAGGNGWYSGGCGIVGMFGC